MASAPTPFPTSWIEALAALDHAWQGGDHIAPATVAAEVARWRQRLDRPEAPGEEVLDVVDAEDRPLGWAAPRWFCHLTGLRHRVAHVFLTTPQGLLALQMRAHDKAEWPSMFDTSVGGHLKAGQDWDEGVVAEIEEELGLAAADIGHWLDGGRLQPVPPLYERYDVSANIPPMRNRQVNRIYTGQLTAWGLTHLRFADGEVAGLYLCSPAEARRMVAAETQIAPGLKRALSTWWAWFADYIGGQG